MRAVYEELSDALGAGYRVYLENETFEMRRNNDYDIVIFGSGNQYRTIVRTHRNASLDDETYKDFRKISSMISKKVGKETTFSEKYFIDYARSSNTLSFRGNTELKINLKDNISPEPRKYLIPSFLVGGATLGATGGFFGLGMLGILIAGPGGVVACLPGIVLGIVGGMHYGDKLGEITGKKLGIRRIKKSTYEIEDSLKEIVPKMQEAIDSYEVGGMGVKNALKTEKNIQEYEKEYGKVVDNMRNSLASIGEMRGIIITNMGSYRESFNLCEYVMGKPESRNVEEPNILKNVRAFEYYFKSLDEASQRKLIRKISKNGDVSSPEVQEWISQSGKYSKMAEEELRKSV